MPVEAAQREPAWTRLVPPLLVALATLFNAAAYRDELASDTPELNDHVFHLALAERMDAAWDAGRNPLDPWIPYWGQGFPVVRYYQHLPHFAVVLLHRLTGGALSLEAAFDDLRYLLLLLVPLAFYRGARWLGFSPLAAALVALCAPFLGADPNQRYYFGFQQTAFTWAGGGLFPQLAGLVLFPLALGATSRAVLEGRRYGAALLALSALMLSHLLLGVMACILAVLLPLRSEARGQRLRAMERLAAILALTAVAASHLLLPTLLEGELLNRSVWEDAVYWDSFGAEKVLGALVQGQLLDGTRLPVITLLAALGLVAALVGLWRTRAARAGAFAALALVLSLALYFGRHTWGSALDALPMASSLPWHRFICAVQLSALLLAGLGLAAAWRLLRWRAALWRTAAAFALTFIALLPAIGSTAQHVSWGRALQATAERDYAARGPTLEAAFAHLSALASEQPGRGYAGTSWDWGRSFSFAGAPVWAAWGARDFPAISYMFHTMGPASDIEVHFDPHRADHYALFNVRYLLAPDRSGIPPFSAVTAEWPGLVAARVETRGYFDVVRADWRVPADTGARRWEAQRAFVQSPWHRAGEYVRLQLHAADAAADAPPLPDLGRLARDPEPRPRPGRVVASGLATDVYTAHIEVDEPAVLLFRMTWHPGWRVTVDGAEAETFMLAPGHLGVAVEPGTHDIEAVYRGTAWTSWLVLGIAVILAAFALDLRRSKRALGR